MLSLLGCGKGASAGGGGQTYYSLALDGSSGYVSVPDAAPLRLDSGSFTLVGWIYFASAYSGGASYRFLDKNGWYFLADSGTAKMVFGSANGNSFSSTASWSGTTWYHVAVTYDGVNAKFYVNGSLETTTAIGNPPTDSSELDMGRHPSPAIQFWPGSLADVAMWATNLAGTDIANLAAGTTDPSVLSSGLVAWWPFQEGGGTSAADTSGNSHDGTLHGSVTWDTNLPSAL